MKKLKSLILLAGIVLLMALMAGCGTSSNSADADSNDFEYKYLTAEECADVLGSLDGYYDGISQKSLDYFMQKKGAKVEEFIDYSKKQACDFTAEEKSLIDDCFKDAMKKLNSDGMTLPECKNVAIAKTTMAEASGASGYTHGTTIFLSERLLAAACDQDGGIEMSTFEMILTHELFHCLTRNNPDFRKDMYSFINFTVTDSEFDIPDEVHDLIIANPDVEHHDSYATFTINGEKKDCYLVFLTKDNFEKPGDSFFTNMFTGLVDIKDGTLYSYEDADDFYDVVGNNTDYCEDPEECMAMNFCYAVTYGMDGPTGDGYKSPEIIEKVREYLKN